MLKKQITLTFVAWMFVMPYSHSSEATPLWKRGINLVRNKASKLRNIGKRQFGDQRGLGIFQNPKIFILLLSFVFIPTLRLRASAPLR